MSEKSYWEIQQEQREQEKLNQQLKIKKMVKKILIGVVAFIALVVVFQSCERIDAGHVGVKVNLYGSGKGVDDVTECTGMVFYNPFNTKSTRKLKKLTIRLL
jgi:hypothetical protein